MRVKLDENLPAALADELTGRGYDVDTAFHEHLGGRPDPAVVRAATAENRMVMTLDRGVGDIRRFPPGSHAGVVVLRPVNQDPAAVSALVNCLLSVYDLATFSRCVVVVEPGRVRVRRPDSAEQP